VQSTGQMISDGGKSNLF